MPMNVAIIIGVVLALAGTIAAEILLLPKKRAAQLSGFFRKLRDYLMFKKMYIESIIRFFFILTTALCVFTGFFLLFSVMGSGRYSTSMAPIGLVIMIVGPIVVRLLYEAILLRIMIWRNTADINAKLGDDIQKTKEEAAPGTSSRRRESSRGAAAAAAQQQEPQMAAPQYMPQYVFCPNCGARYDANQGPCPNGCPPAQYQFYTPQQ